MDNNTIAKKIPLSFQYMGGYVVLLILAVAVSALAVKEPVFLVGTFAVLEAVLTACLHKVPLYVHVIVMTAQICLGFILNQGPFMVIMALLYAAGIILLCVWDMKHEQA
ncbi:MAG: hypothetical protein IIU28_04665 [Lachnospiraceae bacterium]|nr:hypothetical protein [Lachnospiraceae bacterium]